MKFERKQVVFNPADPDQRRMLEHACQRPNFSAYIKRLIQRDMEGGRQEVDAATTSMQQEKMEFCLEGLI